MTTTAEEITLITNAKANRNRIAADYFPFQTNLNTIPIYFKHHLKDKYLLFSMSTWLSSDDFELENPRFELMSTNFEVSSGDYDIWVNVMESTAPLFAKMTSDIYHILQIDPATHDLLWFEIDGNTRTIICDVSPKSPDDVVIPTPKITSVNDGFFKTIDANKETLRGVYGFCLQYAANMETPLRPFYTQLINNLGK